MGCCVSTTKTSKAEKCNSPLAKSCDSIEAQHQPLEEETVKDVVLSETPLSKPLCSIVPENMISKHQDSQVQTLKTEGVMSEVSDLSEICSLTESFSTATAPEKRGDHGEVSQRSRLWVSRRQQNSGEVARSPARGPASSGAGQGRNLTGHGRISEPENGLRRDSGEVSGRRSRSPVTSREMGMRQSGRYNSPSTSQAHGSGGHPPVKTMDKDADEEEISDDDVLPESSETLENPVVSLECFIFL